MVVHSFKQKIRINIFLNGSCVFIPILSLNGRLKYVNRISNNIFPPLIYGAKTVVVCFDTWNSIQFTSTKKKLCAYEIVSDWEIARVRKMLLRALVSEKNRMPDEATIIYSEKYMEIFSNLSLFIFYFVGNKNKRRRNIWIAVCVFTSNISVKVRWPNWFAV